MTVVFWLSLAMGAFCAVAVAALARPGLRTVPRDRIRQLSGKKRRKPRTTLAAATSLATDQLGKLVSRTRLGLADKLELAGVRWKASEVTLMVIAASLALTAVGLIMVNGTVGLIAGVLVPVGGWILLGFMISRRRKAFADQLDSGLMMMASSLRAGYSLLQSVQAMGVEADSPMREEFARVINETRIGRDLSDSLLDVSARMGSEDFSWVTQAIAINREVGGNLAEVFDGVAKTIRDRNQLHRQVSALAAEGKLSAVILMALPFGVTTFLSISTPGYLTPMFTSVLGWALLGLAVVMLTIGGVWLAKTVKIRY